MSKSFEPSRAARIAGGTAPLFELGKTYATPAALNHLAANGSSPGHLLSMHVKGNWGDLCREDALANEAALENHGRILSRYVVGSESLYVITEAADDTAARVTTTILLAHEY